ncbi:unnamed protein product [Allacma fusca]|uniref:EF-hand domain-containing protein n=1 Tax=Allacma fusca TaxID=39272 RepID=A0A8J2LIJ7_9HEXA|nr:unnamed protein product [Allacma fusca]
MLCCAGKCRNRSCSPGSNNNESTYLTFGDYSVFASEMKRAYAEDSATQAAPALKIAHKCDKKHSSVSEFKSNNHSTINCEVFLGGSCNPTTWRQDIAIPTLKDLGISYFNPQVSTWGPELIDLEHQAKSNAEILFFVINNQTRATVAMIEVAYVVAKQRKVILVLSGFKGPGHKISDEPITQTEYEELTRGQLLLQELVAQHGVPVFNDIRTALQCTSKVIQDSIRPQDLKLTDLPQPLKSGHVQLGNKLINLKKTFESLDTSSKGEISLSDFCQAYRILMNRELTREEVLNVLEGIKKIDTDIMIITPPAVTEPNLKKDTNGVNGTVINYEQFWCMMSELMFHQYRNCNSNRSWSNQLSNKASYFVRNVSIALTRLLENVPGSKPPWIPLSSRLDIETKSLQKVYDVYLGGIGTHEDKWRSDVAIPLLKSHGLTFLSPEAKQENRKLIPTDISGIEKSRFLFFYLPENTRSLETCLLAVYYIGLGCQVVLCIEPVKNDCQIDGEKLTQLAIKDYNRARAYLKDMASRDAVPVFEELSVALDCVVEKCKNS